VWNLQPASQHSSFAYIPENREKEKEYKTLQCWLGQDLA
jgi:hypothetical protein